MKNKQILSTGYNGAPTGMAHCLDVDCLMFDGHCVRANHSEHNAIKQCQEHQCENPVGATIYCTHLPCMKCAEEIAGTGIIRVVYSIPYRSDGSSISFLQDCGIEVVQYV